MKNLFDIEQFQQFDNLELIAREVVEGFITGLHRSPFHGFSVEFAEHRLYNPGESTKHIDWKLYGRSDKFFVKQYEEETNLRCQLLIDTSASMLFPGNGNEQKPNLQCKLAFSAYCGAALAYMLRRQRDAIGLSLFNEKLTFHAEPRLASVHTDMVYGELGKLLRPEAVALNEGTSVVPVLHQIAENLHKRSLVVIFSDMITTEDSAEIFQALQHLRYNKHEVVLFHVTDHRLERDFEYEDRPYRFVDLETGEEMRMNPGELKADYKTATAKYFSDLKLKCHQYQIDLVEADIKGNFDQVLWNYLVKRKRLF